MRKVDLASDFVFFKHREIDNPCKAEHAFIDQILILTNLHPRASGQTCRRIRLCTGEKYGIAILGTDLYADFFGFFGAQRLGHRPARFTFAIDNIPHTRRAFTLRPAIHPVSDRAATTFWPGHSTDNSAFFNILGKNRKARAPENIGHIADLERDPQIGFVITIFQHRLGKRDMHPVFAAILIRKFFKNTANDWLDSVEHILLFDKAHLQIKLVEFARAAIGAAIFIAETWCNLEIAIKTGHHNQLLELLGRLRERIKFTRMQTRWHQKVTRAFRRRCGQNRCLEFGKTLANHAGADRLDNLRTQHDVGMWTATAQIKITIAEPCFLA